MRVLIYAILLTYSSFLFAQAGEVPPEPSQPPFEVGALPVKGGYMIEREGLHDLNFRIVDSQIRLYWIDEDGLIAEPDLATAIVRFTGSVRGRSYFQIQPLSGDIGLGSSYRLPQPHIYNVVLVIGGGGADEGDSETYSFRYTPAMSGGE
jgi:hypothetical protein